MKFGKSRRQGGFSTLEAAAALAILSLILGAATQSISLSTRNLMTAKNRQMQLLALREQYAALDRNGAFFNPGASGHVEFKPLPDTGGRIVAVELRTGNPVERFLTFVVAPLSDDRWPDHGE